jgi:hypothetical protein
MKYIITSALGLFMIFSCSLIYCAEKKPQSVSPRNRLAAVGAQLRNEKNDLEVSMTKPSAKQASRPVIVVQFPPRKTTH